MTTTARFAIVKGDPQVIARYLPDNYRVAFTDHARGEVAIVGTDVAGWTLDGYVIPRLASGLYHAVEISDPTLQDSGPLCHSDPSKGGCHDDDCGYASCDYCAGNGCQSCGWTGHSLDPETGEPVPYAS